MDRNDQGTAAKAAERSLRAEQLEERFFFDLAKGHIYRLKNGIRGARADQLQFHAGKTYDAPPRYRQIQITFRGTTISISAHRVIWTVKNRRWPRPGYVIDDIDGDTHNNSITNLREITTEANLAR